MIEGRDITAKLSYHQIERKFTARNKMILLLLWSHVFRLAFVEYSMDSTLKQLWLIATSSGLSNRIKT